MDNGQCTIYILYLIFPIHPFSFLLFIITFSNPIDMSSFIPGGQQPVAIHFWQATNDR